MGRPVKDLVAIGLRAVSAGVLVAAFAALGEMFAPKRFAGVFAGAPSVAIANLTVIAALNGRSDAKVGSSGMVIGGIAFVLAALAVATVAKRFSAVVNSAILYGAWFVVVGVVLVLTPW
jgi:hypothetical protein